MGFLSTVSECTNSGNTVITRIIPDMMFTCTGTVVKWRATGTYNNGRSVNAMLNIWRERSDVSGTYDKVAIIELGTCGSVQPTPVNNVYECTLPESLRVSVQPGDIVGIEIARNNAYRFRLYFDNTNGGPTNYVFNGQFSTVTLSQRDSTSQDQPQISLTVEMAVQTTHSSTTAQLSIASTTELTTAADNTQTLSNSEVVTTTGVVSGVTTTSEAVSDQPISSGANIGLVVGIVVIAVIAVTLIVTVVVLVIILRGTKRNSLSTSVPTDTNQAYGVTKQNDMDKICNDEHIYSYPEVVLNNEVKTKSNKAYATTICTEGNVAYYSMNMFVQEKEAYVTNVVTETNEAPRNIYYCN